MSGSRSVIFPTLGSFEGLHRTHKNHATLIVGGKQNPKTQEKTLRISSSDFQSFLQITYKELVWLFFF